MAGTATTWIRHHPGLLVLLAAVIVGQIMAGLIQPSLRTSPLVGQIPLFPALALAAAIALALLVLWLRIRLGHQLRIAANARALSLPRPASLPKRYDVLDAPAQVTSAALGILDVALFLLIQATLRAPILALADHFFVQRSKADTAFVVIVVAIAVALLIKLWRIGGPVLVLLLWWGIDRLVPTAGFLGAQPDLAVAALTGFASKPALAAAAAAEPTVAAPAKEEEATVAAEATVISRRMTDPEDAEATILKPETAP